MSWTDWSYEDQDDDDADPSNSLVSTESSGKGSVILLIDCHASMFNALPPSLSVDDEDEQAPQCPFEMAVTSCINLTKDMIVGGKNDQLGVVFFGAKHTSNKNDLKGIHVRYEIQEPGADLVKDLRSMLNKAAFDKAVGSESASDPCSFGDVLWACAQVYNDAKLPKKNVYKRIFVFTNRNDPTNGSADQLQRVQMRHKDLDDNDIILELYPIMEAHMFDPKKFWMDVIRVDDGEDPHDACLSSTEALQNRVRKREFKKRALASVDFKIGGGIDIAVKMYCILKTATKGQPVWLESKTNAPLTCQTNWLCAQLGRVLQDHEIKKYHPYGGEKVFFTTEEMNQIKDFGEPSLTLMGFKSMRKLKSYHNIKQPYFIYPDEGRMKGAAKAFNAILKAMRAENKFAVAKLIYRKSGVPRFVALMPQGEHFDTINKVTRPSGLHMIFLPYADDIRNLTFDPAPRAPREVTVAAKALAQKFNLKIKDDSFDNPSLQKHYAVLEALALEEEAPEEVEDDLQQNEAGLEKCKDLFEAFAASYSGDVGAADEVQGTKRKAPAAKARAAPKAPKADVADIDFESMTEAQIKKMTVPVLKEFLKSKKKPVSGKKADLVERVLDLLGK